MIPLARRFDEAVGVDVSAAMRAEARHNADRCALDNVQFCLSDDRLSQVTGEFNFVISYITLQHIPVKRGMKIVGRLLDLVAAGGVAALHVAVERTGSSLQRVAYLAQAHVPGVRSAANILRRRDIREPAMEMNEYPLSTIIQLAASKGFARCVVEAELHGLVSTAKLLCQRNA